MKFLLKTCLIATPLLLIVNAQAQGPVRTPAFKDRPDVRTPVERPEVGIPVERPNRPISPPDFVRVPTPIERPDQVRTPVERPDVRIPVERQPKQPRLLNVQ